MFLPVSLLTGYFSVQIADLQGVYTVKTYWLSFLITTLLSFALLLSFGVLSDSVEGKTVYRSFTKTLLNRRGKKNVG